MDEVDRANDEAERGLAQILRKRLPPGPAATGHCLYCDELLEDGKRWCSVECREGWEKEARHAR